MGKIIVVMAIISMVCGVAAEKTSRHVRGTSHEVVEKVVVPDDENKPIIIVTDLGKRPYYITEER